LGKAPRRNAFQGKTVTLILLGIVVAFTLLGSARSAGKSKGSHQHYKEFIMIRHHLSIALIHAANVVAKDQSKEKIQAFVKNARVKIAKAIEPND